MTCRADWLSEKMLMFWWNAGSSIAIWSARARAATSPMYTLWLVMGPM